MEMPKEIAVEGCWSSVTSGFWDTDLTSGTRYTRADLVPTPPVTVEDARRALDDLNRAILKETNTHVSFGDAVLPTTIRDIRALLESAAKEKT